MIGISRTIINRENIVKMKEESGTMKKEVKKMNKKLHELTEEELAEVSGGDWVYRDIETSLESENGKGEKS